MKEMICELIFSDNIDFEDFYNIDISNNRVTLQGRFSEEKVIKYEELGYKFNVEEDVFYRSEVDEIRIVLC